MWNQSESEVKTCSCRARENVWPVARAGKHVNGVERRKLCKRCKARENITGADAAKHVNGVERGKTCNRCQERESNVKTTQHLSDWLEHVTPLCLSQLESSENSEPKETRDGLGILCISRITVPIFIPTIIKSWSSLHLSPA